MSLTLSKPAYLSNHSIVDIRSWNRRQHFLFFREFEEPYFGVTLNIDCTNTYQLAKDTGQSFYIAYLHKILQVCNDVPALKLRMPTDNEVWSFDSIHASTTETHSNGTFRYALLPYMATYKEFSSLASQEISNVKQQDQLFSERLGQKPRLDVIHFSALPWLNFTSVSHARYFSRLDSVPKISVGQCIEHNGKKQMPVSLHLHHALADGADASEFFDRLSHII